MSLTRTLPEIVLEVEYLPLGNHFPLQTGAELYFQVLWLQQFCSNCRMQSRQVKSMSDSGLGSAKPSTAAADLAETCAVVSDHILAETRPVSVSVQ